MCSEDACKRCFAGNFICPQKEKELGFNEIEEKYFKKYSKKSMCGLKVNEIEIDFFSLHEARNIENYLSLRNDIIEIYKDSESMNKFVNKLFKTSLLLNKIIVPRNKKEARFHLIKIYELLRSRAGRDELNNKVKELFNNTYPLYQKALKFKYTSLTWMMFVGEYDLSLGIGSGFVIDIGKKFYWNFLELENMPYEIKLFLKDLVVVILDKNNFIIGFNKKQINKLKKYTPDGKTPDIVYISGFLRRLNIARTVNHLIFSDLNYKEETIADLVNNVELYKNLLNYYKNLKQDFK